MSAVELRSTGGEEKVGELRGGSAEKVNCECGSVVLKKNYASHVKTKKHLAVVGPRSKPSRSRSVNFADAQQTESADLDDDYDECEEDDEQESDADLEEEDVFEDEVMMAFEEVAKLLSSLSLKIDSTFERVEETRLKVNLCLGEISLNLSKLQHSLRETERQQPPQQQQQQS
jgi:hypothetical protein